jgi:adenylosuccinate lyase
MTLTPLSAISPIDGRYRNTTAELAAYFSEYALIKYRVFVEIEYFIALCEHPLPQLQKFDKNVAEKLRDIYKNFTEADAASIKEIEKITNHDVKAVEYFIKKEFDKLGLESYKEFIHFGLTSQDINNTAIPYSFKEALNNTYYPAINELVNLLKKYAADWDKVPMLAHTHGQPASPSRLGKSIKPFKAYTLFCQIWGRHR